MSSTRRSAPFSITLALLFSGLAGCQGEAASLAFDGSTAQAAGVDEFALRSPAFADGQPIPLRHSAYGDDVSPPLVWDAVAGAQAYALVMEDPDADRPTPYVHWVAWNIPVGVTSLPTGLPTAPPTAPRLADHGGLQQGLNDHGSVGYFGPRPPAGTGVHHYHVQVFALDTALDIATDADRNALVHAMGGHVLGRARLVGTHAAPGEPAP